MLTKQKSGQKGSSSHESQYFQRICIKLGCKFYIQQSTITMMLLFSSYLSLLAFLNSLRTTKQTKTRMLKTTKTSVIWFYQKLSIENVCLHVGQLGSNQTSLERTCLITVNKGCNLSVLNRHLMYTVVDKIHPPSNKFKHV